MKYESFKSKFHGYCRRCINEELGIHFRHDDCEYWEFPETCAKCGEIKNVVVGITPISRIKLWRIKENKSQE